MEQDQNLNQNQSTPSQSSNPEKGISTTTGLLIVLLIAVLAGAGIWYYFNYYLNPDLEKTNSEAQVTIPDETADWQTYTNTKYGYTIKLPQNYTELSALDGSAQATIDKTANLLILGEEGAADKKTDLQIEVLENQTFDTVKVLEIPDSAESTNVSVGDYQAKKWSTDEGAFYLIVKGDDLVKIFESQNGKIINKVVNTLTLE